jgi:ubiquinone/menaquinone biosynthesis C-methylase UbiE
LARVVAARGRPGGRNERTAGRWVNREHRRRPSADDWSESADLRVGRLLTGLPQFHSGIGKCSVNQRLQRTMDAGLQRRLQRYGWDRAANDYELLWHAQLADVQSTLIALASPAPDEDVLDIASGTGLVAFDVARAVVPNGRVLGVDLSGRMVEVARQRAAEQQIPNCSFARMDAEALVLPDAGFDLALCALGLMYVPNPVQALREMWRVLRPGGRVGLAVWGERSRCGWSAVFPIVDAEVASEVCPLFFHLGQQDTLVRLCADANFQAVEHRRIATTLSYADADEACNAAFVGGPVALAWSRFSNDAKLRARGRYLDAIKSWRHGRGYRIPGEFVIVVAVASSTVGTGRPAPIVENTALTNVRD